MTEKSFRVRVNSVDVIKEENTDTPIGDLISTMEVTTKLIRLIETAIAQAGGGPEDIIALAIAHVIENIDHIIDHDMDPVKLADFLRQNIAHLTAD